LEVLLPVRTGGGDKMIPVEGGRRLLEMADRFVAELEGRELVSRTLVGELYLPFLQLLIEAGHANDPTEVLKYAWKYQERLEKMFPYLS
jgi:hypothetical protein